MKIENFPSENLNREKEGSCEISAVQRKIRMCFSSSNSKISAFGLGFVKLCSPEAARLQLRFNSLGLKSSYCNLAVFRDELLPVRLFNFAVEILINKNPPTGSVQPIRTF